MKARTPIPSGAMIRVTNWQALCCSTYAIALSVLLFVYPTISTMFIICLFSLLITNLPTIHKFYSFLDHENAASRKKKCSKLIPDEALPQYSVLVPLYKEGSVVRTLVSSLDDIDYPKEKLDIMLLIEVDDSNTFNALPDLPKHFRIVRIPKTKHRGKANALNFGLKKSTGKYVVVYDAEDTPDPFQLRKAVAVFSEFSDKVWALQANLSFSNPTDNFRTLLFHAEYCIWYQVYVPFLSRQNFPVPLGGSSNHIRKDKLCLLGGWDPFNVTEDADLAIKIYKNGGRVEVLNSTTYEIAPKRIDTWIKQRTRWIKGLIQTFFVHTRGVVNKQLVVYFLLSYSAIFQAIYILITVISIIILGGFADVYAKIIGVFALVLFSANLLMTFVMIIYAVRWNERSIHLAKLFPSLLVYWTMYFFANLRALYQFLFAPYLWEKTDHSDSA